MIGSGRFSRLLAGVLACVIVGFAPPGARAAASPGLVISRGRMNLEIDELTKAFLVHRKKFALPKDFFGLGSRKWKGDIELCGDPLGPIGGIDLGNTSLILERKQDVTVPVNGSASVPICVTAIKLKSMTPITVKYTDGSMKDFDVTAGLSEVEWPGSTMTIRASDETGGTLDICAYVALIVFFRETTSGDIFTYDFGQLVPPDQRDKFLLKIDQVLWRRACDTIAEAFDLPAEGLWPFVGPDGTGTGGELKGKNLRLPVRPATPVRKDGTGVYVFDATVRIDFRIFTIAGVRTLPSTADFPMVLEVTKPPDGPEDEFLLTVRRGHFSQEQGVLGPMNIFFGIPFNCPIAGKLTGARFENGRLRCGTGKLFFFPKIEIENNSVIASTDEELCVQGFFFFDNTILNATKLQVPCQDLADTRGGITVREVGTGQFIGTLNSFTLGTRNDVLDIPCPETITCNEPAGP